MHTTKYIDPDTNIEYNIIHYGSWTGEARVNIFDPKKHQKHEYDTVELPAQLFVAAAKDMLYHKLQGLFEEHLPKALDFLFKRL